MQKERVAAAMSRFGVRSVRVGGVLSSVMVSAPFVRDANTFPTSREYCLPQL